MPPQNSRMQQQAAQRCPACGNEPMKGSKKGEPTCRICHSGLSSSPLGKSAMKAAGDQAAAKVQQAMSQRQKQQQAMRGGQGMRPGMGAPQGQPQVDPRAAAMLMQALAARRGGR